MTKSETHCTCLKLKQAERERDLLRAELVLVRAERDTYRELKDAYFRGMAESALQLQDVRVEIGVLHKELDLERERLQVHRDVLASMKGAGQ